MSFKRDRRTTSCAGTAPVAGKAKQGQPNRKMAKRLAARRTDYDAMVGQTKIGTGKRDSTGYHRPGAY